MGNDSNGQIGTLNEKPLHAALKQWYAVPDDRIEVTLDGFVIDILRGDLLVEIQTRSFSSIKKKLMSLTVTHPLRLVYPIAAQKWIVKLPKDKQGSRSRRKSPKRGTHLDLFSELVSFPGLMLRPTFSLEVLLIDEEEVRRHDDRRAWRRRGWVTVERRLLDVKERRLFETPQDLASFVPPAVEEPFTTLDLAKATGKPRRLAQQMAYCLREMGAITQAGKQGNAILYVRGS
jgi:hypothetical protein